VSAYGQPVEARPRTRRPVWPRVLGVGLGLWAATAVVTWWTQNATLLPTVILLGSFVVPVAFASWAYETRSGGTLSGEVIVRGFIVGGVLGILLASLLESRFLTGDRPFLMYAGVGLIEELVKLVALWWVARSLAVYTRRDGMVLGAAVGFGFAAFETAGYSFNALITLKGYDMRALLETEVLRGLLVPLGHGLWTAIVGGALFASARTTGRLRVTKELVVTYLAVSGLHALWDMSAGMAALLVWFATAQDWQLALVEEGRIPTPTTEQVHLFGVVSWVLIGVVAVWGVVVLQRRWADAVEEDPVPEIDGTPA
jgi:RsiW-degrading membrane proteinase PrsW (M82 family)